MSNCTDWSWEYEGYKYTFKENMKKSYYKAVNIADLKEGNCSTLNLKEKKQKGWFNYKSN